MNFIIYAFPFLFLFFAVFFLLISFTALIKKKPFIINSKWLNMIILISFLPVILVNIFKVNISESYTLFYLITPILFVLLLIFYFFIIKGYVIYCINEDDFRTSIINSLNKNLLNFSEKMNKIELIDLKNEINVSFTSWIGTGMIKLKNKKDLILFKKIINEIKQYYKENSIKPKKIVSIFYLIFGIIFITLSIGFTIFVFYINKF